MKKMTLKEAAKEALEISREIEESIKNGFERDARDAEMPCELEDDFHHPRFIKSDDGSVDIELSSPDIRFGITFEEDGEQCGWWYVNKKTENHQSGKFPDEFLDALSSLKIG